MSCNTWYLHVKLEKYERKMNMRIAWLLLCWCTMLSMWDAVWDLILRILRKSSSSGRWKVFTILRLFECFLVRMCIISIKNIPETIQYAQDFCWKDCLGAFQYLSENSHVRTTSEPILWGGGMEHNYSSTLYVYQIKNFMIYCGHK